MRIYIHEPKGFRLWLALPTRIVSSRLLHSICRRALKEVPHVPDDVLTTENMERFAREIMRMKRKYPRMELVDIQAEDGTIVKVRL